MENRRAKRLNMPNEKDLIREFVEDTPRWHKSLMNTDKDCAMCGCNPDKMLALAESIRRRNEELVKEIEGMKVNFPWGSSVTNKALDQVLKLIKK